jgi:hypothetical protein
MKYESNEDKMTQVLQEHLLNQDSQQWVWNEIVQWDLSYRDALNLRRQCRNLKDIIDKAEDFWLKQLQRRHHCTERCKRQERIRFSNNKVPQRTSRCLQELCYFAMRWSKFHIWQYINIRELLDVYDKYIISKYRRSQERTLHLLGTVSALQSVEDYYRLEPPLQWDKVNLMQSLQVIQEDIRLSTINLCKERNKLYDFLLKLLNSNDNQRYFLT